MTSTTNNSSNMDTAQNREKEARRAAIRQASEQSLNAMTTDSDSDSDDDDDDAPKQKQKMQARKAAIRQASQRNTNNNTMMQHSSSNHLSHNSNRSLNSSMSSLSSAAGEKDSMPKQQEKELRRAAAVRRHSQRSLGRADSTESIDVKRPAPVGHAKMAPRTAAAPSASPTPHEIGEQEKQKRRERLPQSPGRSNRSLSPPLPRAAAAAAAAAAWKKAPPSTTTTSTTTRTSQDPMTTKEQEKQRRKERLEAHSRQNSGRSLASGRSISPGPTSSGMKSRAQQDAERQRRAVAPAAVAPGAVIVAQPVPPADSRKAARAPDPVAGLASCRAVEGNLENLHALAKQRAASRGGGGIAVGAFSVPHEPPITTPAQQIIEASYRELDSGTIKARQPFKSGAVPTAQPPTRNVDKGAPPQATTAFQAFTESVLSEIQPVPAPIVEEAPVVPGAFCSAGNSGVLRYRQSSFVLSAPDHDSLVQDVEAPDPLPEEYCLGDNTGRTTTINSNSTTTNGDGGLIEATLVEDVVEATIATAYVADDLEIRKQSAAETARVKQWRILVCLALLATAVAVTVSTYKILVAREHENFQNVVRPIFVLVLAFGLVVLLRCRVSNNACTHHYSL